MNFKRQSNDQQGSTIAVVAICLTIALLFSLGWIFWRNFIYKEPVKTNSQLLIVKPKKTTSSNSSSTLPAPNTKYLVVTQWGVEFPYQSSDTLSYRYDNSSVTVISKDLADKYSGCKTYGAGQINRYSGESVDGPGSNTTFNQDYASGKLSNGVGKEGDYYFAFTHDQAVCAVPVGSTETAPQSSWDLQNSANTLTESIVSKVQAEN